MTYVRGAEELARDMTNAGLVAGVKANRWVEKSAEKIAKQARENAPKNRPQLASSITSEMVGPLSAVVGPENRLGGGYGHIVEKGYTRQAPQPYLGPALDQLENELVRDAADVVRGLL